MYPKTAFLLKTGVLYFCVFLSFTAFCQSNAVYPDVLSTYFYNLASINPGYIPDEGKTDFALGYKFHIGQLKKASTLSFSGGKIFRKENTSAHALRLLACNEQNGPYISSPKAYLNYAYTLPLGEETQLFSGLMIGVASVYYSAPTFSSSAFMPDGSIGLGINHRKVSLGVSSMQIFNSRASPLGETYLLGRYYQAYLTVEQELGIDFKFMGYALWRKLPSAGDDVGGTISFLLKETLGLGASLRYKAGMSFFSSLFLDQGENRFLLALTYNAAPVFTGLPSYQNSFEISLGYRLY